MGWFKKAESINQNLKSDEYEALIKKIMLLESKIGTLEVQLTKIDSLYMNLKGIVNRKIGGIVKEEEKSEDLNTSVPLGIGNGKILNGI